MFATLSTQPLCQRVIFLTEASFFLSHSVYLSSASSLLGAAFCPFSSERSRILCGKKSASGLAQHLADPGWLLLKASLAKNVE
jgi:hypothetical protein